MRLNRFLAQIRAGNFCWLVKGDIKRVRNFFRIKLFLTNGLLLLLFQSQAFAESSRFTCKVESAGPGKNFTFITLTDQPHIQIFDSQGDTEQPQVPVFINKRFVFPEDKSREMLAVALLAISGDRQVVVVVDPLDGIYPEIIEIFLQADK
jgi:hypothetical protein